MEWLYFTRVRGVRREEDEGARDESTRRFDPCGMFVVLQMIFGDSVRQSAVSSDCWKRQYAAASGLNIWSFTRRKWLRGREVLVQTCKEGVIERFWMDCCEGLALHSAGGSAKSLRISCVTRQDLSWMRDFDID